jgi:hypothetical protein
MTNLRNLKMASAVWKNAAIRLARAIIRFQNSDRYVHTDSTVAFAFKILRAGKR